jgi:UPF0755 protein
METIRLTGEKPRKPLYQRIILVVLGVAIIISLIILYTYYNRIFSPNVTISGSNEASIIIPAGSDFSKVKTILYSNGLIRNKRAFEWVAKQKKYPSLVKPGHYTLKSGMNNNDLVNMLRSGAQTPVNVVFNNIRTKEQLAGRIAQQIEADSLSLIRTWNDPQYVRSLGFSPASITAMFIPNTYEMWWTSDAKGFTERMNKEYKRFWDGARSEKAKAINMSPMQVIILASIVDEETEKKEDMPVIAGVYINRLKKGWPLQADPTLKYALGNFELKRVLNVHKEVESPYNTYKNTGLPPGPICIPSISAIDAVLDYRKHDYMFFCAKADMSGYSAFARTLAEHNRNAQSYQAALDRQGIR